jgi:hypothetical protein
MASKLKGYIWYKMKPNKPQSVTKVVIKIIVPLLESYTFRRSSFEGFNQPMREIKPIHFKQNLQLF